MSKKIKLVLDFEIGERVRLITGDDDQVPGIITQITITPNEVTYLVAVGTDEKTCYSIELEKISLENT